MNAINTDVFDAIQPSCEPNKLQQQKIACIFNDCYTFGVNLNGFSVVREIIILYKSISINRRQFNVFVIAANH